MEGEEERIRVNPLSWQSLLIKTTQIHSHIRQGTGFVVKHEGKYYLITNWHVLTNRDPITSRCLVTEDYIPNRVNIYHHVTDQPYMWIQQQELLYHDDGKPRWIEQECENGFADVVALPLKGTPPGCRDLKFYPVDQSSAANESSIDPGMLVYIIGYLEGINVGNGKCVGGEPHGGWPIWITGHIASDPSQDYQDRPVYLINASTGEGLSGAPSFVQINGKMQFLGVYSSGMANRNSRERVTGMGEVWRAKILNDILNSASNEVY